MGMHASSNIEKSDVIDSIIFKGEDLELTTLNDLEETTTKISEDDEETTEISEAHEQSNDDDFR